MLTMMKLFHLQRASNIILSSRTFSKVKRLIRVKKAGSGREKRQSTISTPDKPKIEWQGVGWSPFVFLGVAPILAWVGVALIRPDLRKELYGKLGYTSAREPVVSA